MNLCRSKDIKISDDLGMTFNQLRVSRSYSVAVNVKQVPVWLLKQLSVTCFDLQLIMIITFSFDRSHTAFDLTLLTNVWAASDTSPGCVEVFGTWTLLPVKLESRQKIILMPQLITATVQMTTRRLRAASAGFFKSVTVIQLPPSCRTAQIHEYHHIMSPSQFC